MIYLLFIWTALLGAVAWVAYRMRYISLQQWYAQWLRCLQVKIPKKAWDADQKNDTTNSLKQNIEIMSQVLKSLWSIAWWSRIEKNILQHYMICELLVKKEWIQFILYVPEDFMDSTEKVISAFYPWCVVDPIPHPKYLDEWKYIQWWYFVLSKPSSFPLKTYDSLESDPMDSILSAFSKIDADELLSLQICLSPSSTNESLKKTTESIKTWKWWFSFRSIISNIFSPSKKDEEKKPDKQKRSSQQSWDFDKKIDDELYDTCIRLIAISPDHDRPSKMLTDVSRTLSQYTYVWLNSFTFKPIHDALQTINDGIGRHFSSTTIRSTPSMYLGIKEVISLFHFPHFKFNKNPRIRRQNYKIVPAPEEIPKTWLLIWYNLFWWAKKEVRIKFEDRFRHFYCIWQTWTGKTTMLLTMSKEDLVSNNWFCFIDPHGDFCERLLDYYPKSRIDDLIYFNVADFRHPLWFNVFEVNTEEEKDVVISDLIDMFVAMYWHEIFGPRIQDYFRNAAQLLMAQPEWGTISEVMRLFTDKAFLAVKLSHLTNPVVRNRREKTYVSMWDREKWEIIPYLQAKFSPFTDSWIIRNIVWQAKSSFNMSDAMQQNKVILVNLSKWLLGDENSQLIWRFLTTQIKVAALRRASMAERDRVPFFLYIDEFQNYVSKSIESILSEARKYRLGIGIAHQYIDQMKQAWLGWSMDLSKAIFGNVGNMMSLKIWAPDAEVLEKEFSPEFSAQDLVNMDKHRAIVKLSVDSMQTRPFTLVPVNPYTPALNSPETVAVIKNISAIKRGRQKEFVEKEIFFKLGQ